jgi:hypothetical protein
MDLSGPETPKISEAPEALQLPADGAMEYRDDHALHGRVEALHFLQAQRML